MLGVISAFAQKDSILSNVYEIRVQRVIKTPLKDSLISKLSQKSQLMNGWVVLQNSYQMNFRIPSDTLFYFVNLAESLGVVVDRTYDRFDRTDEYIQLYSSIQSKKRLLKQYLSILDSSGMDNMYAVSRSITDLQGELEIAQGRVNELLEKMMYAEVVIWFQFHDVRPPISNGYSNFKWINTVSLPSVIEDFQ